MQHGGPPSRPHGGRGRERCRSCFCFCSAAADPGEMGVPRLASAVEGVPCISWRKRVCRFRTENTSPGGEESPGIAVPGVRNNHGRDRFPQRQVDSPTFELLNLSPICHLLTPPPAQPAAILRIGTTSSHHDQLSAPCVALLRTSLDISLIAALQEPHRVRF